MRNIIALAVLVSGCAADEELAEAPAAALHHAKRIDVRTSEPPTAIAWRPEGSATWRAPVRKTATHFELAVTGPYRLTVICENGDTGDVSILQLARTPSDDRRIELPCNTVPGAFRVRGTMQQPGTVWLGGLVGAGNAPGWTFDLAADRGRHALVALTGERIAVRRNVKVKHDTTLPPIDIDAEGHPLVPVAFSASNLDGTETEATALVWLDIDETLALIYADDPATAVVAPNAVVRPHDEQLVTLAVHDPNVGRTVTRRYRAGDPTTFALPSGALGPVTFDGFAATWSTLPAYEDLELSFYAFSLETFTVIEHRLEATRRWVEATGATSAQIDLTVPSMRDEWQIDPTFQYQRFIEASRTLPNGDLVGSDISQTVNGF